MPGVIDHRGGSPRRRQRGASAANRQNAPVQAFVAHLEDKGLTVEDPAGLPSDRRHVLNRRRLGPHRPVAVSRYQAPTTRTEMRILTAAEVLEVADAIAEPHRALVLTAAYTGCRFGELPGLRIHRLDLFRRTLTVAEALFDVRGHVSLAPPNTAAARRQVALPRFLGDELESYLGRWPAATHWFVFTAPEGGPLRHTPSPHQLPPTRLLPAVWASAGEPLGFHDLRHTHVAMLIAQGEHPKNHPDPARSWSDDPRHVRPLVRGARRGRRRPPRRRVSADSSPGVVELSR